jgi:DNA modification methylase
MPFKYNPPTRTQCDVCEQLHRQDKADAIIDKHNGKASSANNFPFHNWYNFVLGYTPEFPDYLLEKEGISSSDVVLDPFMGSGTTLVSCKLKGISSQGIDANDFMVEAARTKLNWKIDLAELMKYRDIIFNQIENSYDSLNWSEENLLAARAGQLPFSNLISENKTSYISYVDERRPEMLVPKYISDRPLAKAYIIDEVIKEISPTQELKNIFDLALTSILVPISNVRYGPGFGVVKPRDDKDVIGIYFNKVDRMIKDLQSVNNEQRNTKSETVLGDSRELGNHFQSNSVSLMITSPPYPGDHEYTKHTRLELIFRGLANNIDEFRTIKKRMLRASTTNLYNNDNDREKILHLNSIKEATDLIQERLDHDGATSGFEKLYTKLIWEYFGGMHKTLEQCLKVLKPGGKIALLVSDSHAFKMVHIQSAKILKEIGELLGFVDAKIDLWQFKSTTSHKYDLRENILFLTKPNS